MYKYDTHSEKCNTFTEESFSVSILMNFLKMYAVRTDGVKNYKVWVTTSPKYVVKNKEDIVID